MELFLVELFFKIMNHFMLKGPCWYLYTELSSFLIEISKSKEIKCFFLVIQCKIRLKQGKGKIVDLLK